MFLIDIIIYNQGGDNNDDNDQSKEESKCNNEDDDDDKVPGKCFFFISNSCQMCTHEIMCTDIIIIYFS